MTLTEELTRNDTLWIKNHHVNYSKKYDVPKRTCYSNYSIHQG